jgi:hypothetical protein
MADPGQRRTVSSQCPSEVVDECPFGVTTSVVQGVAIGAAPSPGFQEQGLVQASALHGDVEIKVDARNVDGLDAAKVGDFVNLLVSELN